jgi:hypothetical protein
MHNTIIGEGAADMAFPKNAKDVYERFDTDVHALFTVPAGIITSSSSYFVSSNPEIPVLGY